MNTRHLIIAVALAATSSAVLAQNVSQAPVQGKTRAQVVAELQQAQSQGLVAAGDANYPPSRPFVSTKTRAQVLNELQQARAQGLVKPGDANYPETPAFHSVKSRAQVEAELREYQQHPDPQGLYQGV